MAIMRLCSNCGTPMLIKRDTKHFCSQRCQKATKRKELAETAGSGGNPALTLEHKQPVIEHRLDADCGLYQPR